MPEITVIIPTFNREQYVTRAVDSVLQQTYCDYEIVVVDDGSTDDTQTVLRQYGNKIRYIYQSNQGVSAARNAGIEVARGEWLAFLDSDDEWMPGYLAVQTEWVCRNPTVCMQSTDAWIIGSDSQRRTYFEINCSLSKFTHRNYVLNVRPFSFVVQHAPWQIGSTVIRRDVLVKTGGFDATFSLSEDLDVMARVSLHGDFGMIREKLINVYRRLEPTESLSVKAAHQPVEARRCNERVYRKLLEMDALSTKERRAVRCVISANQRAIGNLLLQQGDREGAGRFYADAVITYPSLRSLGKYFLHSV